MKNNNNPIEIYNARTIGSFFLLAFLAYGLGRHFYESEIVYEKYLGSALIITNSIMVLFIGILLRKIKELRDKGINPYPYKFEKEFSSAQLQEDFKDLKPEQKSKKIVRVAGRVMSIRNMGKISFASVSLSNNSL